MYLKHCDFIFLKRDFANGKALEQSAYINAEVLSCFAFEKLSVLDNRSYLRNSFLDFLLIDQMEVVNVSLIFVSLPESLHIFTCLQQFLLVLSEGLQEDRILHLVVHLMQMRLSSKAQ